jgi:cobalt-zinc-cadmium efflux system outer membrane protein
MTFVRRTDWCRIVAFSLGLVVTGSSSALAQAAAGLTLEQAVAEALQRNPGLAVERSEVEIAKGVRRQAGIYPFNPELEADGGAGRATDRVDSDVRRGINARSVGFSQTIWLQGQRGIRVRGADAGLVRATRGVEDAERQVAAEVLKAYSDLLVSQERLGLAREILGVVRQVRAAAQQLFEADAVPQLDVFRADVEILKAENRAVTEERALATAGRELALLIGRVVAEPLRAVAPSPALPPPAGDLETLRAQALAGRPDVGAALAAVEGAKAEVDLVRAERFLPEVKIGVKYEEALEFDSTNNRRGLLTLSVPLPLWNRRDGDLERARADVAKQQAQVELVRRRIDKEVSVARQQVDASRRILDRYLESILPQQERNFALLREAYAIGEVRITEVFVGQREFIETREAYLEAVSTLNTAMAELYRALGTRP